MITSLLKQATADLSKVSSSPRLDAEVLLSHVLICDRNYLYTAAQQTIIEQQQILFQKLIARRQQGEPIAYIIGTKEFWSFPLIVTKDTLIPRPDTECLVEWILTHFSNDKALKVADLGTGSGAIALTLASERSRWSITATDQSEEALSIAQRNAIKLQLNMVIFKQGLWCQALQDNDYDIIVSNPPYIAERDPHLQQCDLAFEPHQALVSGNDGLLALRQIIKEAKNYLRNGGCLVLEHGYQQAPRVMELLQQAVYTDINSHHDFADNPRFVTAKNP